LVKTALCVYASLDYKSDVNATKQSWQQPDSNTGKPDIKSLQSKALFFIFENF
jgi:hypothetical protein